MSNDIFESETISSETDRLEVVNAVKEAANSMLRIDSEKELIKDIATSMKEKFEIKPSDFNTVVKLFHKQNLDEQKERQDKVFDLYGRLFDKDQTGV